MTREERKQARRRNALMVCCWAIILVWIACLCITYCGATDGEALKTDLAVAGAFAVSVCIVRFIVWLDRGRF